MEQSLGRLTYLSVNRSEGEVDEANDAVMRASVGLDEFSQDDAERIASILSNIQLPIEPGSALSEVLPQSRGVLDGTDAGSDNEA